MITKFIDRRIDYDGSQLRSHWIYEETGILGDACVSFIGSCDVKPDHMIDLEDLFNKEKIKSNNMLHFIIEVFRNDIFSSVLLQHFFVSIVREVLSSQVESVNIQRVGDDLYYNARKLSVSIASVSPLSSLIHIGLNITSKGTPLPTSNLSELSIDPAALANAILEEFASEYQIIMNSIYKVRPCK